MKKYLKYIITLLIFGVVFLFIGEQSVVRRISRARKISALREQRDFYQSEIDRARQLMGTLDCTDSLERFAREKYNMHAPGETIYMVQ